MYHYLQFRPDKKEKWHFMSEQQLEKVDKKPAYISVLKVSDDVQAIEDSGQEPLDVAKYKGPMYFDLDSSDDIDAVLDSSRDLIHKIKSQLGVPKEYIRAWLSGGKGVHFTIDERVFGIKRATKYLPYIYHEIAKQVEVSHLDMGVYSAGRGRLWRCPGVARPGSGTYKVAVTLEELETMDAITYGNLCASPRPEIEPVQVPENLEMAKPNKAIKAAKAAAEKKVRAIKNAKVVPYEELQQLTETPGCIQKLIQEGDVGDSNWNQAAMQVAAWISARYAKEDEEIYRQEVIDPFIENVESSSRPSEKERRKHLKDQINRAFSGKTSFSVGPLIKTIGEPCHKCVLCRGDLKVTDPTPTNKVEDYQFFDKKQKIIATRDGYSLSRGDSPPRPICNFSFWPHTMIRDYEEVSNGVYVDNGVMAMVGTVTTTNQIIENYTIPTEAWSSSAQMKKRANEMGVGLPGGDADMQMVYQAITNMALRDETGALRDGINEMAEVPYCGMILEKHKVKGGKVRHIAHYVEERNAIMPTRTGGVADSKFRYSRRGSEQGDLSPRLLEEEYPFKNDIELKKALDGLFYMNEEKSLGKALGWIAACYLKEHLHQLYGQFPLLNIWGNASAGKSMTSYVICRLGGMDYLEQTQAVNMEAATPKPLYKFVSSSTTVPRLIEELNQAGMRPARYEETVNILKAAYNGTAIQRGTPSGMEVHRIKSPILYVSEQRPIKPSVRNRTVEVMLTAAQREVPGRADRFDDVFTRRDHLFRAAKAILDTALRMSLDDVRDLFDEVKGDIPNKMDERPKYNFRVCLLGLALMDKAFKIFKLDYSERIAELKQAVIDDLQGNYKKIEQALRRSEVDMVLEDFDQMAADPDPKSRESIRPGIEYIRHGNWLSLDLNRCFTKYRVFNRSAGKRTVFSRADELGELLAGEVYFDRMEPDQNRPRLQRFVLDTSKMQDKGLSIDNFIESQL